MPGSLPPGEQARFMQSQHQAQGLQRLFSGGAASLVSVLAGPGIADSDAFVLDLAAALVRRGQRVWLAETETGKLAGRLGCRPLLPWQASRSLEEQMISAGDYGLLRAPRIAGDPAFAQAVAGCHGCDVVLFDGGPFSPTEAPLDPVAPQTLVALLGKEDAEAGYALAKALRRSPARLLLLGEAAEAVAQAARYFMGENLECLKTGKDLCQIGNSRQETSSNTLTIAPNLTWVVSRIMQNDQSRVAHGGSGGKGAQKDYQ